MRWRKLGLLYAPDGSHAWARSHALVPTPLLLENGALRIYFSTCDANMVGRVTYIDVDRNDPQHILRTATHPILNPGGIACFDENGVNVTSIIQRGDELWMYYAGYQLCHTVRYLLFTGLAISRDGGETFVRASQAPILDRSAKERFVRSGATVIRDPSGGFHMWYASGNEFIEVNGKQVPRYGLRYLHSDDGLAWGSTGLAVLYPKDDDEYGFGRPFAMRTADGYRLWYSVRSRSKWYRIGFADSNDGLDWVRRDDEAGIDVSSSGWDSEIVCYASVMAVSDRTFMFYNGNDYGRFGFGVAELENG
ncbi:glucosyl hydrolase [Bradyrhizobium sp. S69]|uniref:glucosyl hydrolase n=1 Tax=Bradyrhizobium sp. S69 TaxID=1641856 RepID=UPI001AEEB790|nr:glucosyl hydrolase [Bradyrhizobium sp. S69]